MRTLDDLRLKVPAPQAVRRWIEHAAVPIRTIDPETPLDDLAPLATMIGDARIVSMGEATHGTHEFFRLKHRLLEFLVRELGFTAFALEANFPEAQLVDRYVTSGEGDPATLLTNMRFWTWDTEEVLDLILWMRRYNEEHPDARPVRFYGIDVQFPPAAVRDVVAALQQVDERFGEEMLHALAPLSNDFRIQHYAELDRARHGEVAAAFGAILEHVEAERDRYIETLGDRGLAMMLASLGVAMDGEEILRNRARASEIRDRAMADTVRRILEIEGEGAKVAIWAHNLHVVRAREHAGQRWMGSHLDERFGPAHVSIGFTFGTGSFQARDLSDGGRLRDFAAPPPPEGSHDEAFATVGIPLFALDLRRTPTSGPVGRWFSDAHVTRQTGAAFSDDRSRTPWFESPVVIQDLFDIVVFVAETTAARSNPGGRREPAPAPVVLPEPANLDFSEGDGLPTGWWKREATAGGDYHVRIEPADDGANRLVVYREGCPWSWGWGHVVQSVDATGLRGRRIRVQAAARVDVEDRHDEAVLYVRADASEPSATAPVRPLAFAATFDRAIRSQWWEIYELELVVPDGAKTVTFGLALTGNGRGLMRNLGVIVD